MIKLIVHNVFKHKFLFILIGLMVVMLCLYLTIGMNTAFSVSESLVKAIRENMSGDLIITSANVRRLDLITKDGEKELVPLSNWQELLAFTRARSYVENASPRLRVWGIIQSDFNSWPVIITGVDPVSEAGLLPRRVLLTGRWLDRSNEINLYYRHSDYLSVRTGDTVGLLLNNLQGYQNYETNLVVGTLDYSDLAYYTEFAFYGFISLDYMDQLLNTGGPVAGEIFVRLKNPGFASKLEGEIVRKFGGTYRFILPQDSSNLVSGIYKLTQFTIYFVAFILLFMVFLCSSFLVSVSIESRRREIGIYQAMGVQQWRIGALFGGEFLLVMLIFGLLGVMAGLFIMQNISQNGIEATIIPLHLIFGRSVLYIQNYWQTFFIIALLLLAAFIGNTVNAIFKLSRLDPVEIMREL